MKTSEHDTLQNEAVNFARRWGHGAVLSEHHDCDVVAVPPWGASILGIEIERSGRNVLRNLSRNFSQGCDHVLIVCPDFKTLGEVARKLSRALPPQFWAKTALVTASALRLIQPIPFSGSPTRNADKERTT